MQYIEAGRGDEDPGFSHLDEEDGDPSTDDESNASERDATKERVGPEPGTSAEDHGLDASAPESDFGHGGQEEVTITRLSSVDEPLEESGRSSRGSGAISAAQSVSVEAGLRNLKVSERDAPEKGERTPVMSFVKPRAPHPGFISCGGRLF